MTTSSTLIVNADDFGRTAGITSGIISGHHYGIVTSTTTMVNYASAEVGVRLAAKLAPNLDIGIHLNLTAGRPVLPPSQVPELVEPDGSFYSIRQLIPKMKEISLDQVSAELEAQIQIFRSWGQEPTHLDCHHHLLYLSPRLFEVMVQIARQHHLPIRYPWHQGEPAADLDELARAHRVEPDILPDIITTCSGILEQSGLRTPDCCILSFYGPGATLENLLRAIAGLPEGVSELICHPGLADRALREDSGYTVQREWELEILCHPRVRAALDQAPATLVGFAALR